MNGKKDFKNICKVLSIFFLLLLVELIIYQLV